MGSWRLAARRSISNSSRLGFRVGQQSEVKLALCQGAVAKTGPYNMVRSLGIVRAAMFLFAATHGVAAVESTRSYVDASLPPCAVRTPLNSTERTKHSWLSEQAQVVQPTR